MYISKSVYRQYKKMAGAANKRKGQAYQPTKPIKGRRNNTSPRVPRPKCHSVFVFLSSSTGQMWFLGRIKCPMMLRRLHLVWEHKNEIFECFMIHMIHSKWYREFRLINIRKMRKSMVIWILDETTVLANGKALLSTFSCGGVKLVLIK